MYLDSRLNKDKETGGMGSDCSFFLCFIEEFLYIVKEEIFGSGSPFRNLSFLPDFRNVEERRVLHLKKKSRKKMSSL